MSDQVIIEEYKLYVDAAIRLVYLRHSTNKFNMTITSGLIAAIWLLFIQNDIETYTKIYVASIPSILLGAIGRSWIMNIRHYRKIGTEKFKIIHEIENNLPIKLFSAEWKAMNPDGEDKASLSLWEENIPKYLSWLFFPGIVIFFIGSFVALTR